MPGQLEFDLIGPEGPGPKGPNPEARARKKRKTAAEDDAGDGGAGGGGPGIVHGDLAEQTRRRYLNYALSVITSRAIPDVRDGLKPVQRRILYTMFNDLHLTYDAPASQERPRSSVTSSASTTRTATVRSTTRWCAWPKTSPCA